MDVSTYPNLSQQYQEDVYQRYVDAAWDSAVGFAVVEQFLARYPYYPEALVFKARLLIAEGQDKEALEILQAAKRIDLWRVSYAFDEAEIQYKLGQRAEALRLIRSASEYLLQEVIEGIENFLIGIQFVGEKREQLLTQVRNEMIRFLSEDADALNLDSILPVLQNHVLMECDEERDEEEHHSTEGNHHRGACS